MSEVDVWSLADFRAGLCKFEDVDNPKVGSPPPEPPPEVADEVLDPEEGPIDYARRLAPKALKTIEKLMDADDDTIALRASREMLDRGYGKPPVTQVNLTPPNNEWPAWLSARRLSYQESAQYAEDIVPRELQNTPRERPQATEVVMAPPAPPPVSFSPFTRQYNLGETGHIAPVYTGYAKSKSGQPNPIPKEEKVKTPTWTLSEPDPYDETPPLVRAMQTPEQMVEQAWERATQAQERIGELERALDRGEGTPELQQAYQRAVEHGLVAQRAYVREKARAEKAREGGNGGPF